MIALTLMSLYPATVLNVWASAGRLTLARVLRWQPYAPRWAASLHLSLWAEQRSVAIDVAIPYA